MNCTRIIQWLPLYASEDLTTPQQAQVRAHLAQCESCAAEAAEFAAVREWMHDLAAPELDEAFLADLRYSVRQELAAQPARAAWWILRWQPLAVAAALLLLIIFSVRLFQMKGVPPTDIVNMPASPQQPDAVPSPMLSVQRLAQTQKTRRPLARQQGALPIKQEEEKDVVTAAKATITNQTAQPEAAAEPTMSRIEWQTADPNIRIIWLTPNSPSVTTTPLAR